MLKANEAIEVHVQGSSSGCVAEVWGDANMVFRVSVRDLALRVCAHEIAEISRYIWDASVAES